MAAIQLPPPALRCRVDSSDLVTTLRRYAEVSGKGVEAAAWRALANWSYQALAHAKALHGKPRTVANIPAFPRAKKDRGNWRLVNWLARRRGVRTFPAPKGARRKGQGPWVRLAKAEPRARRRSAGFTMALILACAKAARRRSPVVQGTGIRAAPRGQGRDVMAFSVTSAYPFSRGMSRAMRPRSLAGLDRNVSLAYRATMRDVVYDMEQYIARKAAEAAARTGLAPRLTAASSRVAHMMEATRGYR